MNITRAIIEEVSVDPTDVKIYKLLFNGIYDSRHDFVNEYEEDSHKSTILLSDSPDRFSDTGLDKFQVDNQDELLKLLNVNAEDYYDKDINMFSRVTVTYQDLYRKWPPAKEITVNAVISSDRQTKNVYSKTYVTRGKSYNRIVRDTIQALRKAFEKLLSASKTMRPKAAKDSKYSKIIDNDITDAESLGKMRIADVVGALISKGVEEISHQSDYKKLLMKSIVNDSAIKDPEVTKKYGSINYWLGYRVTSTRDNKYKVRFNAKARMYDHLSETRQYVPSDKFTTVKDETIIIDPTDNSPETSDRILALLERSIKSTINITEHPDRFGLTRW